MKSSFINCCFQSKSILNFYPRVFIKHICERRLLDIITLVLGEARINFAATPENIYTLQGAKTSYQFLVNIHQKVGWENDPKTAKKN